MAFEIKIILSCLIAYLLGSLSGGIIIPELHMALIFIRSAAKVQERAMYSEPWAGNTG